MGAWRLFVDESGPFRDPRETACVVAGLLVAEDRAGFHARDFEGRLRTTLPWYPWPMHEAHTHWTSLLPLTIAEQPGADRGVSGAVREEARRAVRDLVTAVRRTHNRAQRSAQLEALSASRDALRQARLPDWRHLFCLEPVFERGPHHAVWSQRLDHVQVFLARALGSLNPDLERPTTWAIACGETTQGDAGTGPEAYLAQLEGLLVRARDAILREPGPHAIEMDVLERSIGARGKLRPGDVEALARGVFAAHGIVVRCCDTPRYDERVHPLLVFADRVAFHARKLLDERTLDEAEDALIRWIGVPTRAFGGSLLCATGAASEYVEDRRAARLPRPLGLPGQRPWACEQAREWP